MKLDPNKIIERAGQLRFSLKTGLPHNCAVEPEDAQIESTQVKALCFAICEALNDKTYDTTSTDS